MNQAKSTRNDIGVLFKPRCVAVVGASRRPGSIGGAIVFNLKRDGYTGDIYPVNPNADEVQGIKAYPSVTDIGAAVDLAVIAVPAKIVEQAVDDCLAAGVKGLVVITAGFAEASQQGRDAERRLLRKVRAAGVRMVGPNCMGLLNTDPATRLNVTFTPVWPPAGNIGILSQSGALGLTILDHVRELNLGISSFISVGNKADVSGNDLLTYWKDDPATDVIVLYLESFGNPRKFARITPDVVRRKPVIAVKSGRSAAGTRAASSHSAALASLDVAVDALFEQAGVIRTNTLEEMYDVAAMLSSQPPPKGRGVGVVTNAGGPGIMLADACETRGLKVPELSEQTLAKLREFLPPHAGLANPIDLVATDSPEQYARTVEVVGGDPKVDSVVVIFIPPLVTTRPEDVAAGIAQAAGRIAADKPVLSVFLSVRGTPEMLGSGQRGRIPAFRYPENAAMALAAAHGLGQWRNRERGNCHELDGDAVETVRKVIGRNTEQHADPVWLSADELATVLEAAGIKIAQAQEVALDDAASVAKRMGFPLVAKAVAPGLVHKSDVGGVIMGLESADEVVRAVDELRENMRRSDVTLQRVLLQREVRGGIEALVGVTTDPVFGPLLVCGLGGVHVELLKDVSFRLTPVSDTDATEMISQLRSAPLLEGYRGSPPGDREALVHLIMRLSALVEIVPELIELDLNPVKVLPPGEGVIAVDGRIRISRPTP